MATMVGVMMEPKTLLNNWQLLNVHG